MLTQCNKGYEFDLHTNLDGSQKWGWIKNKSKYRRLCNHLNNILNMQNTAVYYYDRYTGLYLTSKKFLKDIDKMY